MDRKKVDDFTVRPRSTQRKQRGQSTPADKRSPRQDRSRKRFQEILDVTEELLQSANIEDLSLSDIGQKANISKASVHYHFPTVAAIQLELARRHDETIMVLLDAMGAELEKQRLPQWQDWLRIKSGVARDYFNSHRAACECLLGPVLHRRNRMLSMENNEKIGYGKLRSLINAFEVSNEPLLQEVMPYAGEILDTFWSGSYIKNGYIDDRAFDESIRAVVGYLRNFLPEIMVLKKPVDALDEAEAADAIG